MPSFCPDCGARVDGEPRFCASCGKRFDSASPERSSAPGLAAVHIANPSATTVEAADIGRRLGAKAIDVALIYGVFLILWPMIMRMVSGSVSDGASVDRTFADLDVSLAVGQMVFGLAYFAGLEAWKGQTLGKMLLSLVVADARTGALPTVAQAVKRNALLSVSWILLLLEGTFLLFASDGERWGDRWAGTRVLLVEPNAVPLRAEPVGPLGPTLGQVAASARIVQYGKPIERSRLSAALSELENLRAHGEVDPAAYAEYKRLLEQGLAQEKPAP
jgi:uncharacterized RDD family membrane protein YckC